MNGSVRQPTAVFNSAESGNKYVSLYVLLAGISGGMLLVLSLFVFCKFCRGKSKTSEDNNEWTFNHEGSRQYRNVEPGELYIEDVVISPRLQNRVSKEDGPNGIVHYDCSDQGIIEIQPLINGNVFPGWILVYLYAGRWDSIQSVDYLKIPKVKHHVVEHGVVLPWLKRVH